jgi:hypothetical protein
MQLLQIAISPDGAYIYALDTNGTLWAARTRIEGFDGGAMDHAPHWIAIKPPPAQG